MRSASVECVLIVDFDYVLIMKIKPLKADGDCGDFLSINTETNFN